MAPTTICAIECDDLIRLSPSRLRVTRRNYTITLDPDIEPPINWDAILMDNQAGHKEDRQAEFLVERTVPWTLIRRFGVHSSDVRSKVHESIWPGRLQPAVEIKCKWYY